MVHKRIIEYLRKKDVITEYTRAKIREMDLNGC